MTTTISRSETLVSREVLVIVGPSAVGKTSVMDHLSNLRPELGFPQNFTTRAHRPGEPLDLYEHLADEELGRIPSDEIAQSVVHPDGNVYGSRKAAYTAPISVVDAMTSSIDGFYAAGFESVRVVGLIASAGAWMERVGKRIADMPQSRAEARLLEGITCFEWLTQATEVPVIVNDASSNRVAALELIDTVLDTPGKILPRGDGIDRILSENIEAAHIALDGLRGLSRTKYSLGHTR